MWEENWDTLLVFLALSTQWRREIPAMSSTMLWDAPRHSDIESTIRMMGMWRKATDIFESLQIMVAAALPILNKASK